MFVWVLISWLFCCSGFGRLLVLTIYLVCVVCWFVLCVRVAGGLLIVLLMVLACDSFAFNWLVIGCAVWLCFACSCCCLFCFEFGYWLLDDCLLGHLV